MLLKRILSLSILSVFLFLFLPVNSQAADVLISGGGIKKVGEEFTVNMTVSGEEFDSLEGNISTTGPISVVSVFAGNAIWAKLPSVNETFSGTLLEKTNNFTIATITLKGDSAGTGSISITELLLKNESAVSSMNSGTVDFTIEADEVITPETNEASTPKTEETAIPGSVQVSSPSHPDQNESYESKTIGIAWNKEDGVDGFSYFLGKLPEIPLADIADSADTSISYHDQEPGTYYFHIKAHNAGGWGPVTHFKITIKDPTPVINENLSKPSEIAITKDDSFTSDISTGTVSGIKITGKAESNFEITAFMTGIVVPEGKLLPTTANDEGFFEIIIDFPIPSGLHKLTLQGQKDGILTSISDEITFELSHADGGRINFIAENYAEPSVVDEASNTKTTENPIIIYGIIFALSSAVIFLYLNTISLQKKKLQTYNEVKSIESEKEIKNIYYILILIAVTIIGFVIRFIGAKIGSINLDEGIHLYDASLLTKGLMPFRDYYTREPYYITLISFFVKTLGTNLLSTRLISVISATLTIPIIYLIGKEIFSKKIGLYSAAIFALSPSIIYNNVLGNLYSVYQFVLSLCLLVLIRFLNKPSILNITILGLLFGLSTHFYRITVFYLFVLGFSLGMHLQKIDKKSLFYWFYIPLSLPFFLPLVYYSIHAGYTQFKIIYGTDELIQAYLLIPVFFLLGILVKKYWSTIFKFKNFLLAFVFVAVMVAFAFSLKNIGIPFEYKKRIAFGLLFQNWPIIILILIALPILLEKAFDLNHRLMTVIKSIILLSIIYIAYIGSITVPTLQNFGVRITPSQYHTLFLIFLVISSFSIFAFNQNIDKAIKSKWNFYFLVLMFFAPAAFYLIHVQWNVGNFLSFSVTGSILAGFGLWIIIKSFANSNLIAKLLFITSFSVIFALLVYFYATIPSRDRMWPQQTRKEISEYILSNTEENEEIFTNALVFVAETNRRAVLDNSRAIMYAIGPVEMPDYTGVSKNIIPSKEFSDYIKSNINLILKDCRTTSIISTNPDFTNIQENFYLDKSWPEYEIEAWKRK